VLRCAAACRELELVRPTARLRVALLWLRAGGTRSAASGWAVAALLGLLAVGWSLSRWPSAPLSWLAPAATIAAALWPTEVTGPSLAALAATLGSPALASLVSAIGRPARELWRISLGERKDAAAQLARVALLVAVGTLLAVPRMLAGRAWHPSAGDDVLYYLFGASRLLTTGSLSEGLLDVRRWYYSSFSALLAVVSVAAGRHPMVAFRWIGYAGCALLPLAAAAFAWIAGRSYRRALLTCFIASAWGGLAGYAWLAQDALPRLLSGRLPRLMETDYYEPRFFGEYAGPYSDLVSYLSEVPFYPREAGLLLFWPGLALLYRAAPRIGLRSILGFGAFATAATTVYPYYGISAGIALASLVLLELRGSQGADAAGHGRPVRLVAMLSLVAALAAVGAALVARYRRLSLLDYLHILWTGPIGLNPRNAVMEFEPGRLLSSHFFLLLVLFLGWRSSNGAGRLRQLRAWPAAPLLAAGLTVALGIGALCSLNDRAYLLFTVYRWVIPWRCLVEPALLFLAASALERLWLEGGARRWLWLLVLPCLSPLHWTINGALFLEQAKDTQHWRGESHLLYDEYAEIGRRLLGRVRIREPFLLEGSPLRYGNFVQAALGVWDAENLAGDPGHPTRELDFLLDPGREQELLDAIRAGRVGDVGALRDGEFRSRARAKLGAEEVAAFGPYVLLRIEPHARRSH
jgi:hypothetical protein